MADIRKRVGKKGTTYQVRYPSTATKTGYAFKSFDTLKEARAFVESGKARASAAPYNSEIKTVDKAIQKWLDICQTEGRDGRDPVTAFTLKVYEYRGEIMKAYDWDKSLHELQGPDIVAFRSWLLKNYSRDQAKKALSSFQSVMKEMVTRGYLASNPAIGVAIRSDSRYDTPVSIPTAKDIQALLSAADELANSANRHIARTWQRYRPILYLAADTGMRPQEYLALAGSSVRDHGVAVERAIECGGYKISVTKTPAGRRFIDLSPHVYEMVTHYRDNLAEPNAYDLIFPTSTGRWIKPDNWRKRGFYSACEKAGLLDEPSRNILGCRHIVVPEELHDPGIGREGFPALLVERLALPPVLKDHPELHAEGGDLPRRIFELAHMPQHRKLIQTDQHGRGWFRFLALHRVKKLIDENAKPAGAEPDLARGQA